MRHVLSAIVEDRPGVLARIAGLFSARGFNIESLAVGPTETPGRSRMTLVVDGDNKIVEQVRKQLEKLIDVLKVIELAGTPHVERELALVKLKAPPSKRAEVMTLVEVFRGKVVDVSEKTMIVEASGTAEKLSAFLRMMKPFGILETARTGCIALKRNAGAE